MFLFTSGSHRDTRGVSEVISFLLIFSLLIGIAISTTVFGINSLETARNGDELHQALASMQHLRADVADLSDGAVYRSTRILLYDHGSLRYGDPITIVVEATTATGSMDPVTIHPHPIVYELGPTDMVYVSGGVLQAQSDGGLLRTSPRFHIAPDQSIIRLVNTTYGAGPTGVAGGTFYVVSYRTAVDTRRYEPTNQSGDSLPATVTITIESPRTQYWAQYFETDPRFHTVSLNTTTNQVSAQFTTHRLFIQTTSIDVRFDS